MLLHKYILLWLYEKAVSAKVSNNNSLKPLVVEEVVVQDILAVKVNMVAKTVRKLAVEVEVVTMVADLNLEVLAVI